MTQPIHNLLPLPMDAKERFLMSNYYNMLHEVVCFGTHILDWGIKAGEGKENARNELDAVVPLLFRHILELLDSISVQIQSGVIAPCSIQLRAMFEAGLSLEYMLEKNRHLRAACFFITDHYRHLSFYNKFIPGTEEYNSSKKAMDGQIEFFPTVLSIETAVRGRDNALSLIDLPHYREAKDELLRHTNKKVSRLENLKWYALFGGPENVFHLAKKLNRFQQYDLMYKTWSNPVHGTSLHTGVLLRGEDGYGAFAQLRNTKNDNAETAIAYSLGLSLMIFDIMKRKVVTNYKKDFINWEAEYERTYGEKVKIAKMLFALE